MKNNFAETLKNLRKENNLSQEKLAAYIHMERQTVSSYENGTREPSIDTIIRLAEVFNISVDELLGYKKIAEKKNLNIFKKPKKEINRINIMTKKEIEDTYDIKPIEETDGFILGRHEKSGDNLVSIPKKQHELYDATFVLGSAGAGKSNIVENIIYQAIKNEESIIINDVQYGNHYYHTAKMLEDAGYTIKILNFADTNHSDSWNPLSEIVRHPENIEDAINKLSELIIQNSDLINDEEGLFDTYTCQNLFSALCCYIALDVNRDDSQKTIHDVIVLIDSCDDKRLDSMFRRLRPGNPAIKYWMQYSEFSSDLRAQTKLFLKNKLRAFDSISLNYITSYNDIDTELPVKRKCAYFIILSMFDDMKRNFLSSVFYDFCFCNMYNYAAKHKNIVPVNFIFDEFTFIPKLKYLDKIMSVASSTNMRIFVFSQSITQIKQKYEEAEKILKSCKTIINMGLVSNQEMTEYGCLVENKIPLDFVNSLAFEKETCLIEDKFMVLTKYSYYENTAFKNIVPRKINEYIPSHNTLFISKAEMLMENSLPIPNFLNIGDIRDDNGFVLGVLPNSCKAVSISKGQHALYDNTFVFGGKGSGLHHVLDTIIWQAVKNNESVIVKDSNGTYCHNTAAMLKAAGYKIKILDLDGMNVSTSWNLLHGINKSTKFVEGKILTIAELLTAKRGNDNTEDIKYSEEIKSLLTALLFFSCFDETKGNKNIVDIIELLMNNDDKKLNSMFNKINNNFAKQYWNQYLALNDKNRQQTRILLLSKLKNFAIYNPSTSDDEIDLELPVKEKCAYFIKGMMSKPNNKLALSLFFDMCLNAIYDSALMNISNIPVNFVIDRFDDITEMKYLKKIMDSGSQYNIRIVLTSESLKDGYEKILNCCNTIIYAGQCESNYSQKIYELFNEQIPIENIESISSEEQICCVNKEAMILKKCMPVKYEIPHSRLS